jgi:vacuolar-type H+-ATPase subunit F/Vma7
LEKIAFIGQERLLRVFRYFGTSVFQVSTPQEAGEKIEELVADTKQTWGIIYIEEALADAIRERIMELNREALPVISIVSASGETKGIGGEMLHALVRKATGVDMRVE